MKERLDLPWVGPIRIEELLDCFFEDGACQPPVAKSVYLVTEKLWKGQPTAECIPLYVGSNARNVNLFRRRVGDLIADLFGFFSPDKGHHSGGQELHRYCRANHLNPRNIYISWLATCECPRCAECRLYYRIRPKLNRKSPPSCDEHGFILTGL